MAIGLWPTSRWPNRWLSPGTISNSSGDTASTVTGTGARFCQTACAGCGRITSRSDERRCDGSKQPPHLAILLSARLHQFDETIVTRQRLARALQPASTRVIGSDELRGSVTLKLVASVHFSAKRIANLTSFDGNSIGGSSRLRVVTADLTFVHYLSLDWLDCPGLLMSGGARDRFSELNRAKNKPGAIAGQSNFHRTFSGN